MMKEIWSAVAGWLRPRKALLEPLYVGFMKTKHGRTRELYECTLRKLRRYCPEFGRMVVEEVTAEWLRGFEAYLGRTAPRRNARNIHLRNLRTVFYIALDDGLVTRNPFRRFKIRAEPTRKRALTAAQLRKLAEAELEPWLGKYRDAFLLMFMLRGINSVDFCRLEKMEGSYIHYRRSKTGRLFTVRVEPEARALIERLRGRGQLLYPLDRVKDYRTYTARLNKALQRIASTVPGLPADLTSYWARHSWATIASRLGISKDTIAAALGHSSRTVTDTYIVPSLSPIHTANRKVIRAVFGEGSASRRNRAKEGEGEREPPIDE